MESKEMKCALFYGKKSIKVDSCPIPKIEDNEVLIKVEACGICGTDVSMYKGQIDYPPHIIGKIFGHEVTGIIEKKGSMVNGHDIGQRVAVCPDEYCGTCYYCKRGDGHLCTNWKLIGVDIDGGYAQYIKVNQKQVFELPGNIGFEEGTLLTDAVVTQLHAIKRKANIKPGDYVAIWGTGAQGYLNIQLAHLSGGIVIVIGRSEQKLQLAKELGADFIINSNKEDVIERIKDITKFGADVCFDCGGYAEALSQSLYSVRKGGSAVMVGLQSNQNFGFEHMLWNEKNLLSSSGSTYQEFETGIRLAESGKLELKRLITHRFNLDDINTAFEVLSERKGFIIKAVIKM